ncbi:MAG TPA: glutamine synthetase family protein [Candidatus Limnocylindria bacterium]|jgi:glutamine synthetase|nr:glutamine synthetase family protein [Candidatus Limnocylindria bacterium]
MPLNELRDFLQLTYAELEELNLKAKQQRKDRVPDAQIQAERLKYLDNEERIKAVTVLFSDLEGRLHMLDYDKKFLVKSADNLTFDGSSIRGFTPQRESDLRLALDWSAFYWAPADFFGPGKVLVFGDVLDRDGTPFAGDVRGMLKRLSKDVYEKNGYTLNAANEIEGFLFKGLDAERRFHETGKFEYVNTGGYYHSLPGDPLRTFIDTVAEVQRAMGFQNEKDHPEVAPSQFEINYSYGEVVAAADQIQLYKLICRQVATQLGMTVSFLPKPVVGVNGSGMHTNVSISNKDGKNLFWDPKGEENLSKFAWEFTDRILTHGNDICLMLNSSVNAYRRLDPHFEAPNQIKASAVDRGSMVRIPIGNERSARVEVRSVAPDANPYMVMLAVFKTGLEGTISSEANLRQADRFLPDNIYDAITNFRNAEWTTTLLTADVKERYAELKQGSADRCPRLLGTFVKAQEVQYHHEVYNQFLWNQF